MEKEKRRSNSLEIEAFFRKFPFLERYLKKETICSLEISKINEDLFGYMPYHKKDVGFIFPEYHNEKMFFVKENGEEILTVGEKKREISNSKRNLLTQILSFFSSNRIEGETVEEAIKRADYDIGFILSVIPSNRDYCDLWDIIIYKMPKKVKISQWRELQISLHQENIERLLLRK